MTKIEYIDEDGNVLFQGEEEPKTPGSLIEESQNVDLKNFFTDNEGNTYTLLYVTQVGEDNSDISISYGLRKNVN